MKNTNDNFRTLKVALTHQGQVLTFLTDDASGIRFPAHWDLPGQHRPGQIGRSHATRLISERFGLRISPSRLVSHVQTETGTVIYSAELTPEEFERTRSVMASGSWSFMPVTTFVTHGRSLPSLRQIIAQLDRAPARMDGAAA